MLYFFQAADRVIADHLGRGIGEDKSGLCFQILKLVKQPVIFLVCDRRCI